MGLSSFEELRLMDDSALMNDFLLVDWWRCSCYLGHWYCDVLDLLWGCDRCIDDRL